MSRSCRTANCCSGGLSVEKMPLSRPSFIGTVPWFCSCLRVTGDAHLAEDVFQAAFLTLARRARTIHNKALLAGWLHTVTVRIAQKARTKVRSASQHTRQRQAVGATITEPIDAMTLQELNVMLEEEISHLPEKYKTPIVLCYLQGKSHDKAARELGWPKRSVTSRLARARELLRQQLTARGATLTAAMWTAALSEHAAQAELGALLTIKTVKAAKAFVASKALAQTLVSARAIALAEEAMSGLIGMKAKLVLAVMMLGFAVGGAGLAVDPAKPATVGPAELRLPQVKARLDHLGDPLPEHALLRIGSNRLRPGGVVTAMTFTADGKRLVSINSVTGGHVWEAATGRELSSFGKPMRRPSSGRELAVGAISPDGSMAAHLDADGPLRVYETVTGKAKHELQLPNAWLLQTCISPDNKLFACSDSAGMTRIWELSNGKEPLWTSDSGRVLVTMPKLAFGPDSKTLAMLSKSSVVEFFDSRTGKLIKSLDIKDLSDSQWLQFAPDGKTFVTRSGFNTGAIMVRDSATGQPLKSLHHHPVAGRCDLHCAAYSPDGKSIAIVNGTTGHVEVALWDVATGKQLRGVPCHSKGAQSVALAPDGKVLATGDKDGLIGLLNAETGDHVVQFEGHGVGGIDVRFLAGGKELVSLTKVYDERRSEDSRGPRFWNASTGKLLSKFTSGIYDLSLFSPDGRIYASSAGSAMEKTLLLHEVETGKQFWSVDLGPDLRPFHKFGFQEDGRLLVAVGGTSSSAEERLLQLLQQFGERSPLGMKIRVWDTTTGKPIFSASADRPFSHADDRNVYLDVSKSGELTFWESRTGTKTTRQLQKWHKESSEVQQFIAISPNSHLLASLWNVVDLPAVGLLDGSILPPRMAIGDVSVVGLWDVATGNQIALLREDERFKCLAINADSRLIAAGTQSGNVYLWHPTSDKPIGKLSGHRAGVLAIDFSSDGKRLVSSSDDTTMLVWDVTPWTVDTKKPQAPLGINAATLWKSLADPRSPYPAMDKFLQSPKETVAFLRDKLREPAPVDIQKHIDALDSPRFADREQASAAIHKLGFDARSALLKTLKGNPTLELRRRVELLLAKLENEPLPSESLQILRGLDILEMLATPDAIALLDTLSRGDPDTWLTQEAAWSLKRARKRLE